MTYIPHGDTLQDRESSARPVGTTETGPASRFTRSKQHVEVETDVVTLIPALRAFARTFYRNSNDADDLVQDVLMRALGSLHQFEPGTALKSWLFTIMRNTFYTRIKKSMRESPGAADCASFKPVTQASQEWTSRAREVDEALRKLPDRQREVIMLICILGVSYEEAAEVCGCPIGTIKSRLNRARATLVFELGEETTTGSLQSVVTPAMTPPANTTNYR